MIIYGFDNTKNSYRDWFFQWAFATTAATIVSGALAERTKIFAEKTNSEFVGFPGVTHGFCKEGYEDEIIEDVIVNHNAEFPVPTSIKEVFAWIQKGKVWKDTDWMRVDTSMTYDAMASERVLNDLIEKLK